MQKLRSIQALRAVAACSVLVSHTYEPIHDAAYGAAGVDLFFVISGFIMANLASERSAGEFARNRLSRIYPLWWIAALPWLLLVPRGPFYILSTLTLWPVYGGAHFLPVLKVGWTLCLEVLFYAGVTLAMATRPAVALAIYLLLLTGALTTPVALLHFVGSPMALEFLMGIAVARLPRRKIFGLFILVGLAALPLTSTVLGDLESSLRPEWALQRAFEWGCPAALIVWGALSLEGLLVHRLFDVPVKVGDASYSIYLFHPLIAYGLDLIWPVRLALGIGAGLAMYALIERKIMAARKRLRSEARTPFDSASHRRRTIANRLITLLVKARRGGTGLAPAFRAVFPKSDPLTGKRARKFADFDCSLSHDPALSRDSSRCTLENLTKQ